jgi:mRNA interferase MazF
MTVARGEVWFADLNPTRGSEQAGVRPVIIFQTDRLNEFTSTVLAIPLTTNLRRAALPSCLLIHHGEGGLASDSVALCHQMRVIDKTRLQRRLGILSQPTLSAVESRVLFTTGVV